MSNQHSEITESGAFRTCEAFKLEPQTPCLFEDAYGSYMKVGPVKMPTFEPSKDAIGPVQMPTFEPSKDVIGPVKMPSFDSPDSGTLTITPCDSLQKAQEAKEWDRVGQGVQNWIDDFGLTEEEKAELFWEGAKIAAQSQMAMMPGFTPPAKDAQEPARPAE